MKCNDEWTWLKISLSSGDIVGVSMGENEQEKCIMVCGMILVHYCSIQSIHPSAGALLDGQYGVALMAMSPCEY